MGTNMRPSTFEEILGQDQVITRLQVSVAGCKNMGGVMPHVLIDGPPGLGKTTIASAIANEMGVNLYTTNAASIRSIKNILPYIMGMSPRSILFIDEIKSIADIYGLEIIHAEEWITKKILTRQNLNFVITLFRILYESIHISSNFKIDLI